eukprot:scaffold12308_cov78-Skeletonema_dohrnii-CCMP3373.AAC.1
MMVQQSSYWRNPLVIGLLLCNISVVASFLPSWIPGAVTSAAPPELNKFTSQIDTVVNARLNIGLVSDQLFVIDNFQFQLCNDPLQRTTDNSNNNDTARIPLPGADGPRPNLSSGPHRIDVTNNGSFINMDGLQTVQLKNGVWELVWNIDGLAGLIICGFQLDQDAHRNDAILEKGNLYLTFPIWSTKALQEKQAEKQKAELKYKEYETERNLQLEKLKETPNLLKKAMYFRQAFKAVEDMDNTGFHLMVNLPSEDEVLDIDGNGVGDEGLLKLVKTGTLWSKTGSFRSNVGKQKLIGTASLL